MQQDLQCITYFSKLKELLRNVVITKHEISENLSYAIPSQKETLRHFIYIRDFPTCKRLKYDNTENSGRKLKVETQAPLFFRLFCLLRNYYSKVSI